MPSLSVKDGGKLIDLEDIKEYVDVEFRLTAIKKGEYSSIALPFRKCRILDFTVNNITMSKHFDFVNEY